MSQYDCIGFVHIVNIYCIRIYYIGRKSYETVLDNYTDKWFQSQKGVLDTIIEQDKMQKELIQQEMEKQREWEEREMEKERDFQREQTNQIMQTFVQTIHMLRPQMPFFQQNTYKPFKLIPVSYFVIKIGQLILLMKK